MATHLAATLFQHTWRLQSQPSPSPRNGSRNLCRSFFGGMLLSLLRLGAIDVQVGSEYVEPIPVDLLAGIYTFCRQKVEAQVQVMRVGK